MVKNGKKRGNLGRTLKAVVMATSVAVPTLASQSTNTTSAFLFGMFGNSKSNNKIPVAAEDSGMLSKFPKIFISLCSAKTLVKQLKNEKRFGVAACVRLAVSMRQLYDLWYSEPSSSSFIASACYSLIAHKIENMILGHIVYPLADKIDRKLGLTPTAE